MKKRFEEIFDSVRSENVQVKVANVGERPCGDVDEQEIESLKQIVTPLIEEVTGRPLEYKSSSTDCNIPLSLGIPAICIGVCDYEGMHTREEWVEKKSLEKGLEIAIKLAYRLT